MRRSQQRLAIWMNGIPVGYWEKRKGEDRLEYLPEWIADSQEGLCRFLCLSRQNQPYRGSVVRDYFDNLLPDSEDPPTFGYALSCRKSGPFRFIGRTGSRLCWCHTASRYR